MENFICTNVYIPLRAAPSHRAEMVSQVIFGERFRITDTVSHWFRIETLFDDYRGWIDAIHGGFGKWDSSEEGYIAACDIRCAREDGSVIYLPAGSELFGLASDLSSFEIAGERFKIVDPVPELFSLTSDPVETALRFINSPYLWGGRTSMGIDCSGLVQIVFKIHGIALPRDASVQALTGDPVEFFSEAKQGDLLFFSSENGAITHTGILTGANTIIHSSGVVRIDRVDHQGIWRGDNAGYSHRLRLIKRLI